MSVSLKWEKTWITQYVTSIKWSGSAAQCSRSVEFSVLTNPYDKTFKEHNIKLGDIVYLYVDKKRAFVGKVTGRDRTGGKGTVTYQTKDIMHYLLRSKTSRNFRNTTAEAIAKAVCGEIGIKVGTLAKTNVHIKKYYPREECHYNIILGAYRKARKETKKKYMPVMDGVKFCVVEKGESSGVSLSANSNILSSSYSDNIDSMTNKVRVYDDKGKQVAVYENEKWTKLYGIYQETYTKESGVNAKTAAEALFVGIEKSASLEALGDVRATSGKSIKIKDSSTGLTGIFWIENDEHTWENGQYHMSLELAFKNTMEYASVNEADEEGKTKKGNGRAGVSENETINKVTSLAKSFQGKVRYVWGATSPQNGKSDCSGFTQYVFKKAAGIDIGRTTNNQVRYGEKVYKSRLKIGDLVMFKGTYNSGYLYGVSHVGIYIGQNQFIHCSSSKGVTISSLGESTWEKHWLMGRRIIK